MSHPLRRVRSLVDRKSSTSKSIHKTNSAPNSPRHAVPLLAQIRELGIDGAREHLDAQHAAAVTTCAQSPTSLRHQLQAALTEEKQYTMAFARCSADELARLHQEWVLLQRKIERLQRQLAEWQEQQSSPRPSLLSKIRARLHAS